MSLLYVMMSCTWRWEEMSKMTRLNKPICLNWPKSAKIVGADATVDGWQLPVHQAGGVRIMWSLGFQGTTASFEIEWIHSAGPGPVAPAFRREIKTSPESLRFLSTSPLLATDLTLVISRVRRVSFPTDVSFPSTAIAIEVMSAPIFLLRLQLTHPTAQLLRKWSRI